MGVYHGYLGLGSNLGEREIMLADATALVQASPALRLLSASRIYCSAPVGFDSVNQFLNQVLEVEWQAPLTALIGLAMNVQAQLGRLPGRRVYSDRLIDIDLLHFDGVTLDTPELTLPHPRLHERAFVLLPLVELAPGLILNERPLNDWIAELPVEQLGQCRIAA